MCLCGSRLVTHTHFVHLAFSTSDEKKLTKSTLVYGEIKFDSFAIAFEKVQAILTNIAAPCTLY